MEPTELRALTVILRCALLRASKDGYKCEAKQYPSRRANWRAPQDDGDIAAR